MHGILFGTIVVLIIAIWVAQDANKRGMNGILWALGVFLFCIVFLPLYLIVRKPIVAVPPPGYPGAPGPGGRVCPNCGKYHDGSALFCPFCGAPQPR